MGRSHLQTVTKSVVQLSSSDAGSESEEVMLPENAKKLANPYRKRTAADLIGDDSDSAFATSKQEPKKPRLVLSTDKKRLKNSKKSLQKSQKSSPVPSTSGLAQTRESTPEFSDVIC